MYKISTINYISLITNYLMYFNNNVTIFNGKILDKRILRYYLCNVIKRETLDTVGIEAKAK